MKNQPTKTNKVIKIVLIVVALMFTFVIALSVFAWWRIVGHHLTDGKEKAEIIKQMEIGWKIEEECQEKARNEAKAKYSKEAESTERGYNIDDYLSSLAKCEQENGIPEFKPRRSN